MDQEFTLADLTKMTGAKRRSVQLWAEAGVIEAMPETERAGTGTHRRFSHDEAIICLIISQFSKFQISIGKLKGMAGVFRNIMVGGKESDTSKENITRGRILASIHGSEPVHLTVSMDDERVLFRFLGGDEWRLQQDQQETAPWVLWKRTKDADRRLGALVREQADQHTMVTVLLLNHVLRPLR